MDTLNCRRNFQYSIIRGLSRCINYNKVYFSEKKGCRPSSCNEFLMVLTEQLVETLLRMRC